MASGQKKKRLNGSSVESFHLGEHCSTKKKKNLDSLQNFLNMRGHTFLEWDDNQQRVVAKREQIGIAWRELTPFINPSSPCPKDLADVFSLPQEIYGLKDVTEVLSSEVWETHLSESERKLLTMFLPEGPDTKEAVQALLTGENLHFGNPFLKWGASLCSGNFHPDAVVWREECLKAEKKAYYLELHKYHNDMVGNLQKLKEIWESCEDPEVDIIEKMRSCSKKQVDTLSSRANGFRACEPEENLAATTESCSWIADEQTFSGKKHNNLINKLGELQERNGSMDKRKSSSTTSERTKVTTSFRKEEKPHKLYVRSGDGERYMSYFKITRKQHQLVKGMKQSGSGIKSTSLNRVLGDIKSFKVQPYEVLEEEENKKLHDHWLKLAVRDLPPAFANWKERQLRRQQWRSSLQLELAEKEGTLVDEDEETRNTVSSFEEESDSEEERDSRETYDEAAMDMQNCVNDEESALHSINSRPLQRIPSLNGHHDLEPMDEESEEGSPEVHLQQSASPDPLKIAADRNSTEIVAEQKFLVHSATNSQPLMRIPSLNHHHHELDAMDVELGESSRDTLHVKPDGALTVLSDFVGTMSSTGDAVQREGAVPSPKDAWSEVSLHDSHIDPTPVTYGYTSSSELSLGQPHMFREQPNSWIDLEADLLNQDAKGHLLHRPSNTMGSGFHVDNGSPVFGSYTNQDRNEPLQPFLRVQGMVPSHTHAHARAHAHDQKQVGLQFLGTRNGLPETGHHVGHSQEQHLLLMQMQQMQQMRKREISMQQVAHKNMYPGGVRYPNPSQEHFMPVDVQNWDVHPDHVSAPVQRQSIGREFLGHNSFPVGHQASGGVWSGMDVSSSSGQYLRNGSNADGSLYSVVPQLERIQSQPSYISMGPPDHHNVPSRNFVSGGNRDGFPHTGHQLNYINGHDAAAPASMKANNMSWMNVQHQNSGLHDSIGKPFVRSWNQ